MYLPPPPQLILIPKSNFIAKNKIKLNYSSHYPHNPPPVSTTIKITYPYPQNQTKKHKNQIRTATHYYQPQKIQQEPPPNPLLANGHTPHPATNIFTTNTHKKPKFNPTKTNKPKSKPTIPLEMKGKHRREEG